MALQVYVANLRDGRRILPVPWTDISVENRRNSPESITVQVSLLDPKSEALDLENTAAEGKTLLAVFDGDYCVAAGPIWEHEWDEESNVLTLTAEGMWSLFYRRFILPQTADTMSLLVQTGDDAGEPNPATATKLVGLSWPALVRSLIVQSFGRAGGSLPLVFGDAGVGSHDHNYEGSAFKTIGSALDDLTQLDDGPEIQFVPRWTADKRGIEFLVRVGDDTSRELTSASVHRFDFSARKKRVRKLKVKKSATEMTSEAWAIGGRQAAVALIARAASTTLTDLGYPRLESISSNHSTVELQSTLDSYAREDLALGSKPTVFWTFEADMDSSPRLGEYGIGDYCNVVIGKSRYLKARGPQRRRIAAISVSSKSRWAKLTMDEV